MATLKELITKVIPLKGILRIPSYWMRKVLTSIADAVEAVKAQADGLQSGKTSMTYFPKSNSVLLQDGNGYVQLFGTRSGDGTMVISFRNDSDEYIKIFGKETYTKNGDVIIKRNIGSNLVYIFKAQDGYSNGESIKSINLSHFCTINCNNMREAFKGCNYLTSLDLSNFDTSAVTNMSGMFYGCSNLTSLDLSSFDTSAVTSMYQMFCLCNSLTSLDLSSFDTSAVTSMTSMFSNCSALRNIKCKQAFKDWCVANASTIGLTIANITWEIVE